MFERFEKKLLDLNTDLDSEIAKNIDDSYSTNEVEDSYNYLVELSNRINSLYNEVDAVHNDLNTDDYTFFRGAWENVYEKCRVALIKAQQLFDQKVEAENEASYAENERQSNEENERIEAFTRKQEEIHYNNIKIDEINKLIENNQALIVAREQRISRLEARLRFMDNAKHIEFSDVEKELLTDEIIFVRNQIEDLELANKENMDRMTDLTHQNEEIYRNFTEWELSYQNELTKNKQDKFEEQERQAELDRKQRDEERKRQIRSIAGKKAAETRRKNAEAKKQAEEEAARLAEEEAKKADEAAKVEEEKKTEEELIPIPVEPELDEDDKKDEVEDDFDKIKKPETEEELIPIPAESKLDEDDKKDEVEDDFDKIKKPETEEELIPIPAVPELDEDDKKEKETTEENKKKDKKEKKKGVRVLNIKAPNNKLLLVIGMAIGMAIQALTGLLASLGAKGDKIIQDPNVKSNIGDDGKHIEQVADSIKNTLGNEIEMNDGTKLVIPSNPTTENKPVKEENAGTQVLEENDVATRKDGDTTISVNADGDTYIDGVLVDHQELQKDEQGRSIVTDENLNINYGKDGSKFTSTKSTPEVPNVVFSSTVADEQKNINQEQKEINERVDEELSDINDINDILNSYRGR